jgi:hypothetical protein
MNHTEVLSFASYEGEWYMFKRDQLEDIGVFLSSLGVQTSSEAHLASSPIGTGGPFLRGKVQLGRDTDHSPPFT